MHLSKSVVLFCEDLELIFFLLKGANSTGSLRRAQTRIGVQAYTLDIVLWDYFEIFDGSSP